MTFQNHPFVSEAFKKIERLLLCSRHSGYRDCTIGVEDPAPECQAAAGPRGRHRVEWADNIVSLSFAPFVQQNFPDSLQRWVSPALTWEQVNEIADLMNISPNEIFVNSMPAIGGICAARDIVFPESYMDLMRKTYPPSLTPPVDYSDRW